MIAGESWAYRKRGIDPLVEVRVIRLGDKTPARVLVSFVDAAFEGKEEWIPPARLKVLWAEVDKLREFEAKWAAIENAGINDETPESSAAGTVFERVIQPTVAEMEYRHQSACRIRDLGALSEFLDLPATDLIDHPSAFTDDEGWIVPWAITELIARRAAERDPQSILRVVDEEWSDFEKKATYGDTYRWSKNDEPHHIDADWYAGRESEYYHRPAWELLRRWCGEEAAERYDELKELRKEIRRLGKLAADAIAVARQHGAKREADALERDLGIPVEILRAR